MDASSFLERQEELRARLRRAPRRSAFAKKLQGALIELVREELRRETSVAPHALPPVPRDFRHRVGDDAAARKPESQNSASRQGELYGGQTPYWVER